MNFVKLLALLCLVSGILSIHPRETRSRHIVFHNGKHIDTTEHPSLDSSAHGELKQRFGEQAAHQYLLHFGKPLLPKEKENIENQLGVKLGVYMPHHTYLVYGSPTIAEKAALMNEVKWIGIHPAEFKIAPNFFAHFTDKVDVLLAPLPKGESRSKEDAQIIANQWAGQLEDQQIQIKSISAITKDKIQIETTGNRHAAAKLVDFLAQRPQAHFIEPAPQYEMHMVYVNPVIQTNNKQSDPTPYTTGVAGLSGSGQVIALADSGISTVSCFFNNGTAIPINAVNSGSFKVVCYNTTLGDANDVSGHGTLMAGIIAGNDFSESTPENGVATNAKLYVYDISTTGSTLSPPADVTTMFGPAQAAGANTFLMAFGARADWYGNDAAAIDDYVSDHHEFLPIVSAGNNGPTGGLSSLALAKNALAVGSTISTFEGAQQDLDAQSLLEVLARPGLYGTFALAPTSSCGPTPDGRIKPDVVAPGQRIKAASTAACGVVTNNGTSLAAAVVAGTTALVREYFDEFFYPFGIRGSGSANPVVLSASLLKAVLINSGQSLTLADATGNQNYIDLQSRYPSGFQGFGRIQLDQTLFLDSVTNNMLAVFPEAQSQTVSTGTTNKLCFVVSDPTPKIKVTLVWTDPAGTPTSGHILVNDLDLAVMDSTGRLWKTITSNGDYDAFNNVEQVEIMNPALGGYAIVVHGRNVPVGTTQTYSLVISGIDPLAAGDCSTFPADVCPNSCSGIGSCRAAGDIGTCDCGNSGREGVDCSIIPCPSVNGIPCGGNGYCDYLTSTCVCALNFAGIDCTGQRPPETNGTTAVVIQYYSGEGGFTVGVVAGAAVAAFVIGVIIAVILGAFIAVKILERQRDKAMKDKMGME